MPKYTPDVPEMAPNEDELDVMDTVSVATETEPFFSAPQNSDTVQQGYNGISSEELKDPNKIRVTIADNKVPLVVFFGPPSCGKTMTLIRLTRYLNDKNYQVKPVRTFRPSNDTHYLQLCNDFDKLVGNANAAASTNNISFMLVEIYKEGKSICQILEAPGEFYFNPQQPNAPFPAYVNTIIHSNNRKVWCHFVEPDWLDETDRSNYVKRIGKLKKEMKSRDKTLFVFNKIDKTQFVVSAGVVRISEARRWVEMNYRGLFEPFRNNNPITSFFSPWRCGFVPFQTGSFTSAADGILTFQQGHDQYPQLLWKSILKYVKG